MSSIDNVAQLMVAIFIAQFQLVGRQRGGKHLHLVIPCDERNTLVLTMITQTSEHGHANVGYVPSQHAC